MACDVVLFRPHQRSRSPLTLLRNKQRSPRNGGPQPLSFRSFLKGWAGELVGTLSKKLSLDSEVYFDINNVTIPTSNGTTQIDHIIVSRYGIFVVEAKNLSGWIFGDEHAREWTQCLPGGKKFKFQNPLHQNLRHTKALSELLGIEHEKFHSVVMFWGECEFQTPMPTNVMSRGYTSYIKSQTTVLFSDQQVGEIVAAIRSGMLRKSFTTRREHVSSLKERFSSTTVCPKCGGDLVLRTAKSGARAGSQFNACSKFPACRYTAPTERNNS